ncbi:MAG: metallophosphoesterase [Endomicrobiales bacterium]|nr:metallophosphoesterase [Endomicrobiales bacterium]
MNILSVSDIPSRALEALVLRSPEELKKIDLIISCGDLEKEYLEFLVDGIDRDILFVFGNHEYRWDREDYFGYEKQSEISEKKVATVKRIAGATDLHARVEERNGYIFVGFGGSILYNGGKNQFSEKEMEKIVSRAIIKVRLEQFKMALLRKKVKGVVVISHAAPFGINDQSDPAHIGFKCFNDFMKYVSPTLWLHGHIHLQDMYQNQIAHSGSTTVLNTYGHKFIKIDGGKVEVSYTTDLFDINR